MNAVTKLVDTILWKSSTDWEQRLCDEVMKDPLSTGAYNDILIEEMKGYLQSDKIAPEDYTYIMQNLDDVNWSDIISGYWTWGPNDD